MPMQTSFELTNPIATVDQAAIEQMALRVFAAPSVRLAREQARALLLADETSRTVDGAAGLDRALDQWVMGAVLAVINNDPSRPRLFWGIDNTPRAWFGGVYPGAAVAIDNPDNVNRTTPIDGRWCYKIAGCFAENSAGQTSFMVTMADQGQLTMGAPVATAALTNTMIETDADGCFVLTMDTSPANGRSNHLQIAPGPQQLAVRDSMADWRQTPAYLDLLVVDGPELLPVVSESELTRQTAERVVGFVEHWLEFKRGFWNQPAFNTLVGPIGRDGGWGYQAGGRFQLADDEVLVITTESGGAAYTGLQISDPWMMSPIPFYQSCSRNLSQSVANADGSYTYVLSLLDPGVANWINTAGLHEGWIMLRWQNVPAATVAETLLRSIELVKSSQLDSYLAAGVPRVSLAERSAELALRAPLYRRRSQEG